MNRIDSAAEQRTLTLDEIFSQPECWSDCLSQVARSRELHQASKMASPGCEWMFVGCGSSFYLAQAAAATFSHLGLAARAVPASELLLFPELAMPSGRKCLPVMISRSGLTSEVLRATRMLESEKDIRTLAVTCAAGQPLEALSSVTLKSFPADEKSTVMTRSFTSMLLTLQYLGATVAGRTSFRDALVELPMQVSPLLTETPARLKQFIDATSFDDYVFLAQGPLFGIASEAMLKITESSCSYAQVFHSMEFRHGPKSIVSPETLITFFISESSYEAELEVLQEMKQLGGATMVMGNALDDRVREAADFSIDMLLSTPEFTRLAAYTIWGQLAGVFTGLKKGLNPDSPKNLSRVVVLAESD
jgi:glucosamine--fructose-6-phosphate aminotransferase (isomerizing)